LDTIVKRSGKGFAGNVLKLFVGSAFAQGLNVLASPILTRLYEPADFGLYSIFMSIAGILSTISCLRYENAIVLPKEDEEAANLMGVSFLMAGLVSLLTVPIIWLGGPFILSLLKVPRLGPYLWLIPPITFFGGTTLGHPALNNWNTRTKKFERLAIIQIINAIIMVGIQLGAGFIGWATGGSLIGGIFVGSVLSTSILGWLVWRDDGTLFKTSIHFKDMVLGIKRYRKFPLYDSWATLLNTISWQLPSFLLSIYFSPTVVGFYALGNNLLRMPMNFIGTAMTQVFFQRAAEAKIQDELAPIVENVFRYLVILGMFPMLLLSVMGRELFIVVFGGKWADAGVYVQILSVWMFFWFISSPLSVLFRVLEKQGSLLTVNVVIFLTRLLSLVMGGWLGNVYLALVLFSVSGVFVYGYMGLSIILISGVSKNQVFQILLKNLGLFLPGGILLLILKYLLVSPLLIVIVAVGVVGLYYLYVLRSDPQILQLLKGIRDKSL
jgi:O-antigen/teichoic acid export membrane protein